MEPIIKAKELFNKFKKVTNSKGIARMTIEQSKQCALIFVNEICNELESERVFEKYDDYWQEVKNEIEKRY